MPAPPKTLRQIEIEVKDLALDLDNPRFYHLKLKLGGKISEQQLEDEIRRDTTFPPLVKAIRLAGVKDPIWVSEASDGKYLVLEGNRRTVALRQLLAQKAASPKEGVTFSRVLANVVPKETDKTELLLQKARLQSGKEDWEAVDNATVVYLLHKESLMAIEDIAAELQIPQTKAKEEISNFELYREYASKTGDDNPKRFGYFSDRPKKIVEFMEESENNKQEYFGWINPKAGKQKIRSIATTGGLRDLAKVMEDPEAFEAFRKDPNSTVEDALEIAKQNDIYKDMPFVKRIQPMAASLFALNDIQIAKIKAEPSVRVALTSLERACQQVLQKIQ
ncbi:MAG: ParB N-terminal domain-containing protein [Nitrososphaerales archaeon]